MCFTAVKSTLTILKGLKCEFKKHISRALKKNLHVLSLHFNSIFF